MRATGLSAQILTVKKKLETYEYSQVYLYLSNLIFHKCFVPEIICRTIVYELERMFLQLS